MSVNLTVATTARSLRSLKGACAGLNSVEEERAIIQLAEERGYFTPEQELRLFPWFARLLTVRTALLETIDELSDLLGPELEAIYEPDEWRCFLLGYSAACMVVGLDRLLVEDLATHGLTQRKLNEGSKRLRIPRKQFTAVYRGLTEPANAWRLYEAMKFAEQNRDHLEGMVADPEVGFLAKDLKHLEKPLDKSKRRYLKLLLGYREHSARRRGASALQRTMFALFELGGRTVSEMKLDLIAKKLGPEQQKTLADLLRPGDVLVTRHEYVLSNLFLPGYWPHAALYIGSAEERSQLGVVADARRLSRWAGDIRVLEALKDGVLFRPLSQTLAVDGIAVIRPNLSSVQIAEGLSRVVEHEGKLYNFDFDFFRSDRLVCTEVIYRAFDGIGPINIQLQQRAGRPTLSAEDLLDLAMDTDQFEAVAVYGAETCPNMLVTGGGAQQAIRDSYR